MHWTETVHCCNSNLYLDGEQLKSAKPLPTSSLPHHEMAVSMLPCKGAVQFSWAKGRAEQAVSKLRGASSEEKGGKQPGLWDSAPAFPEG